MDMVTSTEIRTKMPEVIATLLAGRSLELIHRSKVIGEIKPKMRIPKPFNPEHFIAAVSKLNLPKLTDKQLKQNYRKHIMKKYGKSLS